MDLQKETGTLEGLDNNNNNNIVSITNQVQQNIQLTLNKGHATRLRLNLLSDKQMMVFLSFYGSKYAKGVQQVWKEFKGKMHLNTVRSTIDILESNNLIKRIQAEYYGRGLKQHTLADDRYKWYAITEEGREECKNQINVRPRPIKPLT